MDSDAVRGDAARPRLLFLGHGAERTGPPILLGHLLRGLHDRDRYDLDVVTARSGPLLDDYRTVASARSLGAGREPLAAPAAVLRRVGATALVGPLQDRVRRRVLHRDPRPDLVYVNSATPPTAELLRSLDAAPATPVVVHVHELDIGLRRNLTTAQRTALFDRADALIAASSAVQRLLVEGHGLDPARITTCAEFVDVAALAPLDPQAARTAVGVPAGALVIGSVGLPDWRKDPDHLLRAVHALRRSHPALDPWVVWVGGDPAGADGQRVADEAHRLGLQDRFRHLGHRDRPDHLLGAFDLFALPAREDALPLAALEGAAVGLPLVCFRTGGIADLCDQGAGTAVAYPDTKAFASALGDLLADADRRTEVGGRAGDLVRAGHDLGTGVDRIATVIDAVLEGRR